MTEDQIYAHLGDEGFAKLVTAFYQRVRTDDILGPMYPKDDLEGAEWRLREFLIQRFGGPTRYGEARGHPRLRMRHMPFKVDQAARDRWLWMMMRASKDAGISPEVWQVLSPYFISTANHMMNA
jgi:hemoglobin